MESWSVGFDGDSDVERHAGMAETAAPQREAIRIRMVSDYICPWCYVGLKRVEQLDREVGSELDVCAYDLRPGTPPEGIPRKEAYASRRYPPGYIENLLQVARDSGIDMKRPSLIPNTHKSHEATEFAREHGDLHRFHAAVFAAYFEDERNIGDVDVLCEIGAACGLDSEVLREALTDGRYVRAVDDQIEWGRTVGVSGVPTFVFNEKFALSGAQDYDVFQSLAQRIARGALKAED
jgi:predicted DsbA family dithiol-disulfide isomerase